MKYNSVEKDTINITMISDSFPQVSRKSMYW